MVATETKLFNVGGVLLPRPFKVRRLGHVGLNYENFPEAFRLFHDLLGFRISDFIDYRTRVPAGTLDGLGDPRNYFTRYASDHHSFVFGNKKAGDVYRKARASEEANAFIDPVSNPVRREAAPATAPRNRFVDLGQQ